MAVAVHYLKTWNIEKNETSVKITHGEHIKFTHTSFDAIPGLTRILNSANLIYNTGGAQVLAP